MKPWVSTLKYGLVAVAVTLMVQSVVFAEVIYGEVSSLNSKNSSLSVRGTDPMTGKIKQFKISVPHDTEMEGIDSLQDLEAGDRVLVDATENKVLGGLEANTIDAVEKI